MTLLLIGLIFSMLVYAWKIVGWIMTSVIWIIYPNAEPIKKLESIGQKKFAYIIGGIEHLIISASLLAATLIIF